MSTISLTPEQLSAVIEAAVAKAIGQMSPPKAAKKVADSETAAKAEKYLSYKQDIAKRLAKENNRHYFVCRKGRKLLIWSENTRQAAKAKGLNPDHSLGTAVWSTYQSEVHAGKALA